jgi:hypothetical protein
MPNEPNRQVRYFLMNLSIGTTRVLDPVWTFVLNDSAQIHTRSTSPRGKPNPSSTLPEDVRQHDSDAER